jgi:8-oxo-dGTP pyrophosphatase MutT (NUDIX family)
MSDDPIQAQGHWLHLRVASLSDLDVRYEYAHIARSDGQTVAVLPYRDTSDGREYLVRQEITPSWGSEPRLSAVTGGIEDDYDPVKWARQELLEEAGYRCPQEAFESLGTLRGEKCTDTLYYLYAIDLTDRERDEAPAGDGSPLEDRSTCRWVDDITQTDQTLTYALAARLQGDGGSP